MTALLLSMPHEVVDCITSMRMLKTILPIILRGHTDISIWGQQRRCLLESA